LPEATLDGSVIVADDDPPGGSIVPEAASELAVLAWHRTHRGRPLQRCREVAVAAGELLQLARHLDFMGHCWPD
jgi:hypothetical protein